MADPGESETAGDEPWPCRIHTPTPPLLCTVRSATQVQITYRHFCHSKGHNGKIVSEIQGLRMNYFILYIHTHTHTQSRSDVRVLHSCRDLIVQGWTCRGRGDGATYEFVITQPSQ